MGKTQVTPNNVENLFINGSLDRWQRHTTLSAFSASSFLSDRIYLAENLATGTRTLTREQDVPNGLTQYSLKLEVVTAVTRAVDEYSVIQYKMAGEDLENLYNKYSVFCFWVKSNVTGKKIIRITNGSGSDRRIFKSFNVDVADTWEFKIIMIDFKDGMSSGTWVFDATLGATFDIMLDYGDNLYEATEDTWLNTSVGFGPSDAMNNFHATSGNYIQLAQLMIYAGVDIIPFRRAGLTKVGEFNECMKYYETGHFGFKQGAAGAVAQPSGIGGTVDFKVIKRAVPVITYTDLTSENVDTKSTDNRGLVSVEFNGRFNGSNRARWVGEWTADSEF